MKIKVTAQTLNMFKMNLRNILLLNDKDNGAQLYVITELESCEEVDEIVTKATLFRNAKTEKVSNCYITHIVMQTVHPKGKYLGTLTDEACENMIYWGDLYKWRQNWLFMKEQINHMGLELSKIHKPEVKKPE